MFSLCGRNKKTYITLYGQVIQTGYREYREMLQYKRYKRRNSVVQNRRHPIVIKASLRYWRKWERYQYPTENYRLKAFAISEAHNILCEPCFEIASAPIFRPSIAIQNASSSYAQHSQHSTLAKCKL